MDNYYKTIDILPGKEQTLEAVSRQVAEIREGAFNIHYYLVYENEAGNVYDTYYWARFQSKQFTINPQADSATIEKALRDSIVFIDDHHSYTIYDKEDSLFLRNFREFLKNEYKYIPPSPLRGSGKVQVADWA